MKDFLTKHLVVILYGIALLGTAIIIFLWISKDVRTHETTDRSKEIISQVQTALDKHQADTEKDHDGQDKLLQCLVNLFIVKEAITKVDVDQCVIETQVPRPTSSGGDTAPSSQESAPANQSRSSNPSSSPQSTTPPQPTQPDNSQIPLEEPSDEGLVPDSFPVLGPLL